MPTDTARGRTDIVRFALLAVVWSVGFFGLLRLGWTEVHLLLPFTRAQAALALGLFGPSTLPVEVTLACSGADALALCMGAILAYPVWWRLRLFGAGGGIAMILGLNIVRIGTLGLVAASPVWFNVLHLYLWPALLTLAIAGYVFAWMRIADRRCGEDARGAAHPFSAASADARPSPSLEPVQPTRRFAVLAAGFLLLFLAASPLYLQSAGVLAVAGFVARVAARILGAVGVGAHEAGNVLWTPRGGFLVTQECISTPLIPIYLAAVCARSTTWPRLLLGVIAAAPLFIALGIVRLLVVALPDVVVASPLFLVHAFYQLLLGAVVVFLAALWRHGGHTAARHAVTGVMLGVAAVYLLGPLYTRIVMYPADSSLPDPQGAIALLPAFQLGLYIALWIAAFAAIGWSRFLAGLAVLGLTQMAGLLALQGLASHSGLLAHVRDVRGWAIAGPLLIVAAVVNVARPSR